MPEQFATMAQGAGARGDRQKQRVALLSILGAVVLTTLKLTVGVLTGSLGILAEAAHSTIDLVASVLTFLAVRVAGKPPDPEHRYGHGKAENLAAFVQAGLLLLTVAWIVSEAGRRLLAPTVHVEVTVWSFLVMGISVVIDLWRSRALDRAAREHDSQALAADALNFKTDILSSLVVLGGLLAIKSGEWTGWTVGGWLPKTDAIAALGVSVLVLSLVGRMLRATVDVLLDRAPVESIAVLGEAIGAVPGVIETRRLRLRKAGGMVFADVTVAVPRAAAFAEAHAISEAVEAAVQAAAPRAGADVVVHMEPVAAPDETPGDAVRMLARQHGMRAHNVHMRAIGDHLEADLDVEVPPELTLAAAHARTVQLERDVRAAEPQFTRVNAHLEAPETTIERQTDVTALRADLVPRVRELADAIAGPGSCHDVRVYQLPRDAACYELVLHCWFPGDAPVGEVHVQAAEIERRLRTALPEVQDVLLHAEPAEEDRPAPVPHATTSERPQDAT